MFLESDTNMTNWNFLLSSQWHYTHPGCGGTGAVLGGQNWKRIFEKTMVGFGRTELSLMLSYTELCALSSGHGPRGLGFEEGGKNLDFHNFLGGQKSKKKHENAG